ncbi:MAG TPA: peptide chain release factor N(5)-glutamine methyltransferase, partial [Sulfitobacter sp.]|nr:peptide chain release factor N(5)-glutamine methyltransferase [Sulfitobacter sp.]
YLAQSEMADVSPELRLHEPEMALTDGQDGLSVYRIIAAQAQGYLT